MYRQRGVPACGGTAQQHQHLAPASINEANKSKIGLGLWGISERSDKWTLSGSHVSLCLREAQERGRAAPLVS